jgi:hypothetical protein
MCATLHPLLFPPPSRGRVRVRGISGVPRNEGKQSQSHLSLRVRQDAWRMKQSQPSCHCEHAGCEAIPALVSLRACWVRSNPSCCFYPGLLRRCAPRNDRKKRIPHNDGKCITNTRLPSFRYLRQSCARHLPGTTPIHNIQHCRAAR